MNCGLNSTVGLEEWGKLNRQTDRPTDRQTDRQTSSQEKVGLQG